jgi:hypothetical protein
VQSDTVPVAPGTGCPNGISLVPQYDPVDRVVAWLPQQTLMPQTRYNVRLLVPQSDSDPAGVRAFDGVPLAKETTFAFTTGNAASLPTPPEPVRNVDFCYTPDNVCALPVNACSAATVGPTVQTPGPIGVFSGGACGATNCHGPANTPTVGANSKIAVGSALILSTDGTITGIPSAVQQLLAPQAQVATETATGADPKAPARSTTTPFGQNMPYIDANNPGNSFLLYKLIIGLGPSSSYDVDYYNCADFPDGGLIPTDNAGNCPSDAGVVAPPALVTAGELIPGPVEPWVPDDVAAANPPVAGELARLRFRIRGLPMPFPGGFTARQNALTLSAWIAAGGVAHACSP